MTKAIHYFSHAANQNNREAQHYLGIIYLQGLYDKQDFKKAIHYFTLAANQNKPESQYNLGLIYLKNSDYYNVNKAIHYLSLAADQNSTEAQILLGGIFYEGKLVSRNIEKAIHYFNLGEKQKSIDAQVNLGIIYYEGKHVPRDINKAIFYLSRAAEQNDVAALYNLGIVYHDGLGIPRDIEKAIYYYSLAAKQNNVESQVCLGEIYQNNRYDLNKAIYYYNQAVKQNHPKAQYYLGIMYFCDAFLKHDFSSSKIQKAISLFTMAAKNNEPNSQFFLGNYYLFGIFGNQDIKKAINYLTISSNKIHLAYFLLGYIYHEGKLISLDITKCIQFYKEASSFNVELAKNNLGIIYKHGFDKYIKPNIGYSIILFNEAIQTKKDKVAMYNLAHLYFYNEQVNDISKVIDLLEKIVFHDHEVYFKINGSYVIDCSKDLLRIALYKKYGNDFEKIKNDLMNDNNNTSIQKIENYMKKIINEKLFDQIYKKYEKIDFLYDSQIQIIISTDIFVKKSKNIS